MNLFNILKVNNCENSGDSKVNVALDREAENRFYGYYYSRSIFTVRISLVLGFILYAGFGILDSYIAGSSRDIIWFIRYAVVSPVILAVLAVSYTGIFKRIMHYGMGLVALAAGMGIVVMIAVLSDARAGYYYYAGLILVIMWAYTFARLKFRFAAIVCWTVVIGYEITAVFFEHMLETEETFRIFLSNNFFFISANIIGMLVCYLLEDYAKRDFWLQQQIDKKNRALEKERNELKQYNDQFNNELEMARNIQRSLVPVESPSDNIYSIYKPMAPVGGDFFDFLRFRESEKMGIFISDVVGHGVPAALIASMEKSMILSVYSNMDTPAGLMSYLNEQLSQFTPQSFVTGFVTAFYGIFNKDNKTLTYSNAGHMPPYIISDDGIKKIKDGKSIPLAMIDNKKQEGMNCFYKTATVQLPEKCKILFYTDGLYDVKKGGKEKVYFSDMIEDILLKNSHLNARGFVEYLYYEVVRFNGSDSFDDDICIICLDVS